MTYNHRVILRTISVIMLFEGCAMLIPLVCAVYYQEGVQRRHFSSLPYAVFVLA